MALTDTPVCDFGRPAPDFSLPDPSGRVWTRDECRGPNGLLVMFICNHCPYVKAVLDRLVEDVGRLQEAGVGCVAIMPNDFHRYAADAPDAMAALATARGFTFPYLVDEGQDVARAYGAVCTPDFFGYNAGLELQYRGRLDEARLEPPPPGARRDLVEALREIARTGQGPAEQVPSAGCSIKWRDTG